MKNKIFAILLFVPVIVLGAYMIKLISMSRFEKVEVAVQGYDPKDFFSHRMRLYFVKNRTVTMISKPDPTKYIPKYCRFCTSAYSNKIRNTAIMIAVLNHFLLR